MDESARPNVIVVLPTYNEAETVANVIAGLLALPVNKLEVLVVDDASPDGTAEEVRAFGREDARVRLLVREGRRGRGLAGRDGFVAALASGAPIIVEMDADGTHDPADLPRLLKGLKDAALIVGSRLVPGGLDRRPSGMRRRLTRWASRFLRWALAIPLQDVTSGYRVFARSALAKIEPATMGAEGPDIVEEVLLRAFKAGLVVQEVPIRAVARQGGRSKLGPLRLLTVLRGILRAVDRTRAWEPPP